MRDAKLDRKANYVNKLFQEAEDKLNYIRQDMTHKKWKKTMNTISLVFSIIVVGSGIVSGLLSMIVG
jgi:chemotaxis regulatin CheY-phosphate phosphatase CheZ